jgi:type I restriction enzyme, S subunit
VEGALTADWRKSQVATPAESGKALLSHILTERRSRWEIRQLAKFLAQGKTPPKDWQAKYPKPVAPDTVCLPELPSGWVWASVEQLGDVQLGRQRSPDKLTGLNPAPYIRAANITEQGIDFSDVLEMDFSEKERETFQLRSGDVLLTEASGSPQHVGRPVIWPNVEGLYCFQNTVIRFTPLGITSEFAFQLFLGWQKLGVFRRLSGGVGINHLGAGKFSALAVPLPPLTEQTELVSSLSRAFESLALQEQTIEHSLKQSAAQRKNILQAAFSGQLVPQDPADEPARLLLARIRTERLERNKQLKVRKTLPKKKESTMASKLIDVLAEAGDWMPAQEAFRRCGVADGAQTDQIELLYAELRELDKAKRLMVESVMDKHGRKVSDRLKLGSTV